MWQLDRRLGGTVATKPDKYEWVNELYAALESIAELDGKTLLNDPGYAAEVQYAYSQGAAHAFAEAASIAKSVLLAHRPPSREGGSIER